MGTALCPISHRISLISLSHQSINQSSLHGRCGGGGCLPSPLGSWERNLSPSALPVSHLPSRLSSREPHCNLSHRRICDAGLVHPTLTAPSFEPHARPYWLLPASLLVLLVARQSAGPPLHTRSKFVIVFPQQCSDGVALGITTMTCQFPPASYLVRTSSRLSSDGCYISPLASVLAPGRCRTVGQ